jgi:Permuted papain-like amidase enzyme, YaeF/YiiX, C92 family
LRSVRVALLQPGDIVLAATTGKVSKVVRRASKGIVSHAMLCVQHGSTIDSTDDGVQASNIQRGLYEPEDTVLVLRLREPLAEVRLNAALDFARAAVGTRYSKMEGARSILAGPKPRTKQMFCSRLVAQAYAAASVQLVHDPDYCTPDELRLSPLLRELADMTEEVSTAELAAWDARPNPIAEMQRAQNAILDAARELEPSIESFDDVDAFVQRHPEHDAAIAYAYRESGYLDLWRADLAINSWHYDLEAMDAITDDRTLDDLRGYCISTVREFHTGGLRYAVNLAHYERHVQADRRETTAQLLLLYRQIVRNDQMRRDAALAWLRRYFPADAKRYLQRIVPHSELWFSIVDRVEPRLGALARANNRSSGTDAGCRPVAAPLTIICSSTALRRCQACHRFGCARTASRSAAPAVKSWRPSMTDANVPRAR